MTQARQIENAVGEHVDELRRSFEGDVLVPGDTGYDGARVVFNALVDRTPALIVRCAGPADVTTAFDVARQHELDVACAAAGTTRRVTACSTTDSSSTSRG